MVIYLMKYEPPSLPQPPTLDCSSSNSFASYSFRTLASHLKATVSSNSFAINRFRTLCKIPGIGYPPPAIRHHSTISSTSLRPLPSFNPFTYNNFRTLLHNGRLQLLSFQSLADSFHCNGGVYPPPLIFVERPSASPLPRIHPDTGDSTQSNVSSLTLHGSRVTSHESRATLRSALPKPSRNPRTSLKPMRHRAHPLIQRLALVHQLRGPIMRRLVILVGSLAILSPFAAAQHHGGMSMGAVSAHSAAVASPAVGRMAPVGVVRASSSVRMPTRVITTRTRTGGTVVRVIRPANTTRPRSVNNSVNNEDANFSEDFSSAPGLGFDETHLALTRGRTNGRHRRNNFNSGFFPFFDGGFFVPAPAVVEQAPANEVQEESVDAEPQQRVQRVRVRESAPVVSERRSPEPQRETEQYVFVRRDGTVFFAVAYSWDSGMLRYVTQEGLRRSVAGDALDLGATQQFNEQLGLSFHAPA